MEEEVVLLEEQLAAAHADIEQLQARIAETEAAGSAQASRIDSLQRELTDRDQRLTEHALQLDEARAALDASESRTRDAVQRLRQALLEREPDLPGDIVSGGSIEELDTSLLRARETVAQVRQHLEQQAQSLRVPAGAPVRSAPDTSQLSAAEKIRLGLTRT